MKKLSLIVLCTICALSLTACGDNAESSYNKGEDALQEEDYETAIEDFTAAIEANSDYIEAYLERAKAYLEQGETEESLAAAKTDYEKVLELDEGNVDGTLGIADTYIREGNIDAARNFLEDALETANDNEAIEDKLAEFDSEAIYDSSDHLRRRFGYDESGDMLWYQVLTYDIEGRESSATSYDPDGNQTGHVDLEYDEDGKKTIDYEYTTYLPSTSATKPSEEILAMVGKVHKVEYEYDNNGNCIKKAVYKPDGSLDLYFTNEFDKNGNATKVQEFSSDNVLLITDINEYDEDGNNIGWYSYNKDGELVDYSTVERESFEDGRRQRTTTHYSNGNDHSEESEFDDNGKVIKYSYYDNDVLTAYKIYTYNDNGDIIRTDIYDASGNLTSSTTNE